MSESVKEHACETLGLCILTTLNKGLRNGGGIGDVLRPPSLRVSTQFDCGLWFEQTRSKSLFVACLNDFFHTLIKSLLVISS